MPKKFFWLIILFSALFILGVNRADLTYLSNPGTTISLFCLGAG